MIIGYARVSTEEQNLGLQIAALQQAGCQLIFKDKGYSGIAATRPGLDAVLERLETGDTLVVWRLDRLGRSLVHLVETINGFDRRGVHFRSLNESIDTSNSGGRLVFHIMAAMAEFEHALISERTRAGMLTARAAGKHLGRPSALTPEQTAEALSALKNGESKSSVASRYGVCSKTIRRLASAHLEQIP
ncbi:recombinase [Brucella endophytica]|uniref:Recombinase n=1 Tax=Brucella endophytica TaxID=1963359 RepID=A0A916WBU5_9HYPH|nr:recombinase family protein [Brucella endophytica]GGA86561.1 recombinase [Brucella endophytica]